MTAAMMHAAHSAPTFAPDIEALLSERFAQVPYVPAAILNARLPASLRINPLTGEPVVFHELGDGLGDKPGRTLTAAECKRLENRFRLANKDQLATAEVASLEREWSFTLELKRAVRKIAADERLAVEGDRRAEERFSDDDFHGTRAFSDRQGETVAEGRGGKSGRGAA